MYVHKAVRDILTLTNKHSRHRHQRHLALICCGVVFLVITSLRHVQLRHAGEEVEEDIAPVEAPGPEDYEVSLTEEESAVLSRSFRSADFDNDKTLSETEMTMAIVRETKQHITNAMRNNFKVFFSVDKLKKNGQVEWEEYYQHYIKERLGLAEDEIKKMEDNPGDLSRDIKESLANVKAAWSEATRTNPDAVNIDEFLGLEHPESSHSLLTQRVEELMEKFDDDSDGKLKKSEYATDPYKDLHKDEIDLREKEFDLVLDKNKDGVADKREIIQFLDPKNPHWARYEAINLMSIADINRDNRLDIKEVLANPDLFLFSKLVNADAGFHGEF